MSVEDQLSVALIVDDDVEWRDFAGSALGERFPVRFASNGDDALRIARQTRPAVVVLDIMLSGGKDGFTVFCELRNNPETRDIPVIMFSAINAMTNTDFDQEVLQRYLGFAPAAFLEKPVSPECLLAEVIRVLEATETTPSDAQEETE